MERRSSVESIIERYDNLIPDYREVSEIQQQPIHDLTGAIFNGKYEIALEIAKENKYGRKLIRQLEIDAGVVSSFNFFGIRRAC